MRAFIWLIFDEQISLDWKLSFSECIVNERFFISSSKKISGHDEGASDGSATVSKMRQDLPLRAHITNTFRRQTHDMSGIQMRAMWDSGEVKEFAAFAHVSTASRN